MLGGWLQKRKIKKELQNSNFKMAQDLIVKKFSGGVIPNELAKLLDDFNSDPCMETAIKLVEYNSEFIAFFQLSRQGGFSEFLSKKGDLK